MKIINRIFSDNPFERVGNREDMSEDLESLRVAHWKPIFPIIQAFFYFGEGYSLFTLQLIVPLYVLNVVKLGTDKAALATAFAGIPWLIKILYGLISDKFPIGKFGRRKPYLLLIGVFAIPLWYYFSTLTEFNSTFLGVLFVISMLAAFSDAVLDGYVVDITPEEHQQVMQSAAWSGRGVGALLGTFVSLSILADTSNYALTYQIAAVVFVLTTVSALVLPKIEFEHETETILGFKKAFGVRQTKYILLISAFMGAGQVMYSFASVLLDSYGFDEANIRNITAFYLVGNVIGAFLIGATVKYIKMSSVKLLIIIEVLAILWSPLAVVSSDGTYLSAFLFILGMIMTAGTAVISKITMEYSPVEVASTMFALFASVNNIGLLIVSPIFTGYLLTVYSPVVVVVLASGWFVLAALLLWFLTRMEEPKEKHTGQFPAI